MVGGGMSPEGLAYRAQFAAPQSAPSLWVREKIKALRAEFTDAASAYSGRDGKNKAWFDLSRDLRLVVLLNAGIDGDIALLVAKRWDEFTPPERAAMSSSVRIFAKSFGRCQALTYDVGNL
jgi:hypothetical protein